ncbi:MAG: PDZ domain-containing protein, partial [Calditrichaeota bacterium]
MHRLLKKYIIIAPIAFAVVYAAIHPTKVLSSAQELYNKWMVLTMILDKVERFYVDERDPDELLRNAIDGMLSGLDPHSVYISEEQYKAFSKAYEGYFGVGIKYNIIGNQFVVTNVMENGPAAIAGVRVGDRLIKLEGVPISELRAQQIEQILIGSEDKAVTLQVARPNIDELVTFELPKRKIEHKSVPVALMLDEQTGYIKISNFTESTPAEFDAEYAQLKQHGMKRLVLDLRNNGGGAFDAGVAIADRFLSGGKMIVFTKGRALRSSQQYIATSSRTVPRDPLIVLVNEATASDAEIVAGAIQDWDRGLIVGRRTFGKALVQTEFPFQDGSILLLT